MHYPTNILLNSQPKR